MQLGSWKALGVAGKLTGCLAVVLLACCCCGARHGCYVSGLYLEGAGWDLGRGCLRRQDPKVLVEELPLLQVRSGLRAEATAKGLRALRPLPALWQLSYLPHRWLGPAKGWPRAGHPMQSAVLPPC